MKKWYIVHGDNAEALKLVFASVSRYTAVSCVRPEQLTDEIKRDGSLIYIGVKGLLTVPKDGYRIKAYRNENGNEVILLDGDGYANELYAAVDFENVYLVKAIDADTHMPTYFFNDIFGSYPLPEYDESFTPFIKERALWSWGYVIYDYKGYIDHMLRLKLNELIIWSDFPPENADEVVAYAHKKGVRIIWRFSWKICTSKPGCGPCCPRPECTATARKPMIRTPRPCRPAKNCNHVSAAFFSFFFQRHSHGSGHGQHPALYQIPRHCDQ